MGEEVSCLSIGEVAEMIGVSVMTIRSWEHRYGWPRAQRSCAGAHRRYASSDQGSFRAVALLRRTMNTRAAIEMMHALASGEDASLYPKPMHSPAPTAALRDQSMH